MSELGAVPNPGERQNFEVYIEQANMAIDTAFYKSHLLELANQDYLEYTERLNIVAPDGYLLRITVLTDDAVKVVWDTNSPGHEKLKSVDAGRNIYTHSLQYGEMAGVRHLYSSWMNTNAPKDIVFDQPNPYIIENKGIEIGFISVEEYQQRRSQNDPTLLHNPTTNDQ